MISEKRSSFKDSFDDSHCTNDRLIRSGGRGIAHHLPQRTGLTRRESVVGPSGANLLLPKLPIGFFQNRQDPAQAALYLIQEFLQILGFGGRLDFLHGGRLGLCFQMTRGLAPRRPDRRFFAPAIVNRS